MWEAFTEVKMIVRNTKLFTLLHQKVFVHFFLLHISVLKSLPTLNMGREKTCLWGF